MFFQHPRDHDRSEKMLRRSIIFGAAFLVLASIPFIAPGETMSEAPLHIAAKKDDVAGIEKLLAEGAKVDARDSTGATALLVATHENRIGAARALIEAGADVNAKDKIEDSPYLYAGISMPARGAISKS
jgi:hypothetical protein